MTLIVKEKAFILSFSCKHMFPTVSQSLWALFRWKVICCCLQLPSWSWLLKLRTSFQPLSLERPRTKGRPPKHYRPLLEKEKHLDSVVRRILPKHIADIVCLKADGVRTTIAKHHGRYSKSDHLCQDGVEWTSRLRSEYSLITLEI